LRAHCGYCSQEIPFALVGCSTTRRYHERDSVELRKIRPDHLVFFRDVEQAESLGFEPAVRATPSL